MIFPLLMMSLKGARPLQHVDHYSNDANPKLRSYMILMSQPPLLHWLGTSA